MKIAFILGKFPKLSETFILNQITGMLDRGHEVEIYADVCDESNILHPEVNKYDLLNKTIYFPRMPSNQFIRIVKASTLLISCILKNPNAVIKSLDFNCYGWMAKSLRLVFVFKPFILKKKTYDIIHCHFGANGMRAQYLKDTGLISGNLVTVFHGADMAVTIRKHGIDSYKHLLKKGDLFLPISDRWRTKIIEMGAADEISIVHHMGVNIFNAKTTEKVNNNKINILSVCRLTEKKGIKYSLHAVALLAQENIKFNYNIIGDGPLLNELKSLSTKLGLSDKVHFHGALNKVDIQKYLATTDIFILPSVTASDGDQEGIPVSIMEAMMCKLAVISTWHSGIPELIKNGESGILVKERDIEGLANAVKLLIQDSKLRYEMGIQAYECISKNYNIETLNDRLEKHFKRLTNSDLSPA